MIFHTIKMNELFAPLISKITNQILLKSKLSNQNTINYDFAGLLSIVDEDLTN